jgi:uncharacterized membrane protein YadS
MEGIQDYSLVTAAAVSICGSSAVNAMGSTIAAKKDAIFYPIAVMGLFTVPLIPLMPVLFDKLLRLKFGWNDDQGGAWIGGTIDTTGAVMASASIINSEARTSAAIVKMLQNCLIGPICLGVILVSFCRKRTETKMSNSSIIKMLWERFPKFVLGFFLVCGFLTVMPQSEWKTRVIGLSLVASNWFETIGFVCIGLNIRVAEMITKVGVAKLIPFYIVAQMIDMLTTGILVYYAFRLQ